MIVADVDTEDEPAAVDCVLIVPATATTEPDRPVSDSADVGVVPTVSVVPEPPETTQVPFAVASTLVIVTS